jgi:hypothetical protein
MATSFWYVLQPKSSNVTSDPVTDDVLGTGHLVQRLHIHERSMRHLLAPDVHANDLELHPDGLSHPHGPSSCRRTGRQPHRRPAH